MTLKQLDQAQLMQQYKEPADYKAEVAKLLERMRINLVKLEGEFKLVDQTRERMLTELSAQRAFIADLEDILKK